MSNGDEQEMELKDIGKLWSAVHRIEVALTGIDGKNGLRGELRAFQESTQDHLTEQDKKLEHIERWKDAMEARFDSYLKHERAATCVGKKALEDYIAEKKAEEEARLKERRASDEALIDIRKFKTTTIVTIVLALLAAISGLGSSIISANALIKATQIQTQQEAVE